MKRLSKNIASIGGSDLVRKLFGFLAVTYLTRHIGVSDFGIVSFAFTILSYTLIFSASGLPTLGMRETARSPSYTLIGEVLTTRLMLAILFTLIACGLTFLLVKNPLEASVIMLIALSAIPNAMFLDWYFQGKEAMSIIGIARGVGALMNFLVIILFVKSSLNLAWVAFAAYASDFSACMLYIIFARKELSHVSLTFHLSKSWSLLKQALPIGIGSIFALISVNFAPLILGIFLTTRSVGLFSAASKLVFFLMLFDRVLGSILLPASSRIFSQQPEQFRQRLEESLKWVFLIALPICAGGSLLSSQIIQFIFGSQYVAAAPVFSVLIWFLLLTMLQTVFNVGLVAAGKEKEYAKVMGIGMVLYLVFVLVGSLTLGEFGAAIGFVLAEGIAVLIARFKLSQVVDLKFPRAVLQIILAVLLMLVAIRFLPEMHIIVLIAVGVFVYGIGSLLFRSVTISELQLLRNRVW